MFIGEMVLLAVALMAAAFSTDTAPLVTTLFVIGLALGGYFPTAHLVISESIPAAVRGRLVLDAFGFQAVGAVLGTFIAPVVLSSDPNLSAWRIFYLIPVVPVSLVVWGRLFLPESSLWLVNQGKVAKAEKQLRKLLGRSDVELLAVEIAEEGRIQHSSDWRGLSRGKLQRATILASLPWFLQNISTYGIGIFTPVIIATAFGATAKEHNVTAVIHNDLLGARGTALVDLSFLVGIACAIALTDRWGRIPLQIIGFAGGMWRRFEPANRWQARLVLDPWPGDRPNDPPPAPVAADNWEALVEGPELHDGRSCLLLASDDNFNPLQASHLVRLAPRHLAGCGGYTGGGCPGLP